MQEDDPLHAIVRKMVEKISFPSQHKVRIQSNPMQWKVRFIRHKKKFTYMVDGNFAITVADISEHNFEGMNEGEFDMREKGHVEVEVMLYYKHFSLVEFDFLFYSSSYKTWPGRVYFVVMGACPLINL